MYGFSIKGYTLRQETKLYYLQSRYYNPEMGRFINADSFASTGQGILGNNMFAYCQNNPVNMSDPTGKFAISLTVIGLIIGAVVGAVAGGVVAYSVAEENGAEGWELVAQTALGVLGGAALGGVLGGGIGYGISSITGVLGFSITKYSVIPVCEITILGSYPLYTELAQTTSSGYYQISQSLWNSLSNAERWANNVQYIHDANVLGSQFSIVSDVVVKSTKTLWLEIQYLIANGIPWEFF